MTGKNLPNTVISIHPQCLDMLDLAEVQDPDADTYREMAAKAVRRLASAPRTALPWEDDAAPDSVAVHYICGTVFYEHWWRFSTKTFVDELRTVEERPEFTAHLLIVDSPGGEVFFCHEAAEAIRACVKPVIAVCESMCASAAYWMASAAGRIYAVSPFTEIGSIGVMARFLDEREWYRTNGFKEVEIYASGSDLKNKVYRDAVDGRPKEYIRRFLDPMLDTMIADIRTARTIPDGSDALRGELYYAREAEELGLIDGIRSVEDCLQEAHDLGESQKVMNFFNSNL